MEMPDQYRKDKRRWGPVIGYLLLGAAAAAVNLLCGTVLKGGGQKILSPAFFYPLFLGGVVHLLLAVLVPDAGESEYDSTFLGLYNAGILLLAANQAAAGFLEITGKESSYISLMAIIGWTLCAAGAIVLVMVVWDVRESGKYRKQERRKIGKYRKRKNKENREDGMKEEHHE